MIEVIFVPYCLMVFAYFILLFVVCLILLFVCFYFMRRSFANIIV
ncbi:hypothetical protein HMPREF3216_00728 [Gardnerella vaginalis]|uniref:Uncharacterized protein n=1 Tax=Gardnerella vaginalis TaxID=2702 RepID=A0A133NPE4_GARVA|nr:hypothetical protein HMPREF3216_00728 [Gardnerella vaginalis]